LALYESLLIDIQNQITLNNQLKDLVTELELKIETHNREFASQELAWKEQIEILTRSRSTCSTKNIEVKSSKQLIEKASSDINILKSKVETIKNRSIHLSQSQLGNNTESNKTIETTSLPITTYYNSQSQSVSMNTNGNINNSMRNTFSSFTPSITNISMGKATTTTSNNYANYSTYNSGSNKAISQSTSNYATTGNTYSNDYVAKNTFTKQTPYQYSNFTANNTINTKNGGLAYAGYAGSGSAKSISTGVNYASSTATGSAKSYNNGVKYASATATGSATSTTNITSNANATQGSATATTITTTSNSTTTPNVNVNRFANVTYNSKTNNNGSAAILKSETVKTINEQFNNESVTSLTMSK